MTDHTPIEFRDDRLKEIQSLLRKLAPHEHCDSINECAICDQGLDEAILIELRRVKVLRDALEKAPDPHTCGVSDLAHWTRDHKGPALQVISRKPLEGETRANEFIARINAYLSADDAEYSAFMSEAMSGEEKKSHRERLREIWTVIVEANKA